MDFTQKKYTELMEATGRGNYRLDKKGDEGIKRIKPINSQTKKNCFTIKLLFFFKKPFPNRN